MSPRILTVILPAWLLLCPAAFRADAQSGNPFITHIELPAHIAPENDGMVQDTDGVMLFANRRGLLSYDGISWKYPDIPVRPNVLHKHPASNTIFAGENGGYGRLIKSPGQPYRYQSFSGDFSEVGNIYAIQSNASYACFLSHETLSEISLYHPDKKGIWRSRPGSPFTGMIVTNNRWLVNIQGAGLHVAVEDSLVLFPGGGIFSETSLQAVFPSGEDEWVICTSANQVFLFDGETFRLFQPEDQAYISENILGSALMLSETEIALGTYTGGCLIVDKNTGKTNYLFNYRNGLPDDEVLAMAVDRNDGLWLAQEFGLSRVDFSFPVRDYNIYHGLSGNLLTTCMFNNTLYAGTSEGLFTLGEIREYREVEVWVKLESPGKPPAAPAGIPDEKEKTMELPEEELPATEQEITEREPKERRGILRRIFGKKDREEDEGRDEAETGEETPAESEPSGRPGEGPEPALKSETRTQQARPAQPRYVRRKISTLQSVSHVFTKVENLNAKIRQTIPAGNSLLVATNIGIFEVAGKKAIPVLENLNIRFITPSLEPGRLYAATTAGVIVLSRTENGWHKELWTNVPETIVSLWEENSTVLWVGGMNRAFRITRDTAGRPVEVTGYDLPSDRVYPVVVRGINQLPFFFSGHNILGYDSEHDRLSKAIGRFPELSSNPEIIAGQPDVTWLKTEHSWDLLYSPVTIDTRIIRYLWLFEKVRDISVCPSGELWVVHGNDRLSKIIPSQIPEGTEQFRVYFTGLVHARGEQEITHYQEIRHDQFPIEIHLTAPYFVRPQSTAYQYRLNPVMKDWSRWSTQFSTITFHNLPPGSYTLNVRARNVLGMSSAIRATNLVIYPPFYRKAWFIVLAVLSVLLLILLVIRLWTGKLQRDKRILEEKVSERTREIIMQKEEIETQRDELGRQRDQIVLQKKAITDSILYASRIQSAILPPLRNITRVFREHFIIYLPRDIVSGDFYWFREIEGKILVVASDCTGHGVPGAFMSMLGLSALNDIAANESIGNAGDILDELRNRVISALHQTGRVGEAKDGMDISLCIIDKKAKKMQYAGAFNPFYHFRSGKLTEIKADKMPIGIFETRQKPFTNHEMSYRPGDTVYLFSDGFIDQFGGERERKFKSYRFKELLTSIQSEPLTRQQELLEEAFLSWKGRLEQVDDILVIGIRL